MATKPKLELTWIGKDVRPRLEPRILIEEPEFSHHAQVWRAGDHFDNLLIHGDNLLALKALETDPAVRGKVKCIFIDPPYNTGSAFEHYDDGLEHSLWLGMMRDRLELLRNLLAEDGSIWITLDDNEAHYLKVLSDEIFGRSNFVRHITWQKKYSVSNNYKGIASIIDHVMVYRKSAAFTNNLLPRSDDAAARYSNPDNDPRGPWKAVDYLNQATTKQRPNLVYPITNPFTGEKVLNRVKAWKYELDTHETHVKEQRLWWGLQGENSVPSLKLFLSEVRDGMTPHNWWPHTEVGHTDEAKKEMISVFGQENVFDTPKPERLIKRVIELATNPGDLVLDSFAGSGTTGAVAHKMGRRWIMVELGEHAKTHIVPRLRKVIDGTDKGGVTDAAGWKGGGGYRFARLAPSLLERDAWGNWVVSKDYNPAMLAEAMCKHFNYAYDPSPDVYWMHGTASDAAYIYVTTNSLTFEQLRALSDEVGDARSLLICCMAYESKGESLPNLTLRKIPRVVLDACEWGKDDYSLKISALPMMEDREEEDFQTEPPIAARSAPAPSTGKRRRRASQIDLDELLKENPDLLDGLDLFGDLLGDKE